MDDGSNQDIIRKFLRANDSASDGTSIDCKRRIGRSTQVSQGRADPRVQLGSNRPGATADGTSAESRG